MKKKSDTPANIKKSDEIPDFQCGNPYEKLSEIFKIPEKDLRELPPSAIKRMLKVSIQQESYFEGPLPPPSLVKEYEKMLPGSFNRILTMAEENAKHRSQIDLHEMEMEKRIIPESFDIQRSGQKKAFYISIVGIIAVAFCAYLNQPTIGSILAGTTLISLVPNFIAGIKKKKEKPSLETKENI